jgi:thiamine biosynthesis lipoprotein
MLTRIEEVMGMPVIVEVGVGEVHEADVDRVFKWLRFVDRTFSTYIRDSEISRINAGRLALCDAHHAVRNVLSRCEQIRRQTLGYFDIAAAGGSGRTINPSGFVKGWAIEGAGRILARAGARNWFVNAGGDICLHGAPPGAAGWRVGIQHPQERMALAAVVELCEGAIATSGAYERGEHIVDPHSGLPPQGVESVSILGSHLAAVDAYATAAYAMGRKGAEWAARLCGHGAIVIFDDGRIAYSAGAERYLRQATGGAPKLPAERAA